MGHTSRALVSVLTAVTALAACTSGIPKHQGQAQERERYAAYAGEPLDKMVWLGRFDSWESIGANQLVVFTTPSDAFLLTVTPPCNDLPFVNSIALSSTGGAVYARLDSVKVKRWHCPIAEIRKVDYRRMRADMRAEAEKAPSRG